LKRFSPRVDQNEKAGIEFEALLKTPRSTKVIQSKSVETLEVDRTFKNLSEYKASLIAAKAGKRKKRNAEFDARFVKNIQPISVGV
jgi:hypothetical protein